MCDTPHVPCGYNIPPSSGVLRPLPATAFEMKLILMRHAQAEWGFGVEDHDRALSAKGQVEAHSLGTWLTAHDHQPSLALISNAKRTQQTFAALNQTCKTAVLTELYLAESESLLLAIQNIETNCLLVLAHNPGIGELAVDVIDTKPAHPRFLDYPPGATLVLDYNAKRGLVRVINFITPDDLMI